MSIFYYAFHILEFLLGSNCSGANCFGMTDEFCRSTATVANIMIFPRSLYFSAISISSASSIILIPSFSALSSLLPALLPATTKFVFFETDADIFPPRLLIISGGFCSGKRRESTGQNKSKSNQTRSQISLFYRVCPDTAADSSFIRSLSENVRKNL